MSDIKKRVYKYSVPVDNDWHEIQMPIPYTWDIKAVACQNDPSWVEFWCEVLSGETKTVTRHFRVYPTGVEVEEGHWCGTTVLNVNGYSLVWHLYEKYSGPQDR